MLFHTIVCSFEVKFKEADGSTLPKGSNIVLLPCCVHTIVCSFEVKFEQEDRFLQIRHVRPVVSIVEYWECKECAQVDGTCRGELGNVLS